MSKILALYEDRVGEANTPHKAARLWEDINKIGCSDFGGLYLKAVERTINTASAFGFNPGEADFFDADGNLDRVAHYRFRAMCAAFAYVMVESK